jgi:hypothetical protein
MRVEMRAEGQTMTASGLLLPNPFLSVGARYVSSTTISGPNRNNTTQHYDYNYRLLTYSECIYHLPPLMLLYLGISLLIERS